jgi:hypothetical protein
VGQKLKPRSGNFTDSYAKSHSRWVFSKMKTWGVVTPDDIGGLCPAVMPLFFLYSLLIRHQVFMGRHNLHGLISIDSNIKIVSAPFFFNIKLHLMSISCIRNFEVKQ